MRWDPGQEMSLPTGVDNYYRPWVTLGFYLCLAGQIQVKYAFSKQNMEPLRAVCCTLVGLSVFLAT